MDAGHGDPEWICSREKPQYDKLFQTLNPIDGKVTGAGTRPTRLMTQLSHVRHPHATVVTIDRALEAYLSSSNTCTLLTELCLAFNDHHVTDDESTQSDEARINKVTEALSVMSRNCSLLAQVCINESDALTRDRVSSAVSIHSVHDSLALEDRESRFDCIGSVKSHKLDTDNEDSDTDINDVPNYKINENNDQSILFHLITGIKILILIITNMISALIMVNVLFMALVYTLTGKPYIEYSIEQTPSSWFDHLKTKLYGPSEDVYRVYTLFDFILENKWIDFIIYSFDSYNNTSTVSL